jgi:hypothetical protein
MSAAIPLILPYAIMTRIETDSPHILKTGTADSYKALVATC